MSSFMYANYDKDTKQSVDPDKPNLVRVVTDADGNTVLVGADGANYGLAVTPPTDDYDGIMAARAAVIAAGGGVVVLKPIAYPSFGNRSIPVVSGVSYIGSLPVIASPNSGAPDIGAVLDKGTILEADGNTPVFSGRTEPGLEFTGSIVNGVLTVTSTIVSPQTGVVGFLDAGSNIRQDGVIGKNIFIVEQLTSTEPDSSLGKRGTYSVMTTAGDNITNPPEITQGNTWRCEYVSGVTIKDIAFRNAKHAVQIGAYSTQGASWCHFENLHSYNTTGEPYDLLNFEHITVEGLYSFSCAHGPRLAAWANTGNGGLGNSVINKVYNFATASRFERPLVIGSVVGAPGSGLGTLYCTHLQNNQFGRQALDVTFTLASDDANISVPAQYIDQFAVGMTVRFAASLGGFIGGAVGSETRPAYFVTGVNAGNSTVTLSLNPTGTVVTPNASGTVSTRSYGFPTISISGAIQSGTKGSFRGIDMEGVGTLCLINAVAASEFSHIVFTASGEESLCIRSSSAISISNDSDFAIDSSGSNSAIFAKGGGTISRMSTGGGGNTVLGVFRDGSSAGGGGSCFNLASNLISGKGSFYNREPGNGAILEFGTAVAFKSGYSTATSFANINQGSAVAGYGNFVGTAPAIWSCNINPGVGYAGLRQVFKNDSKTAGATLTITLSGASGGTFDGLTDGSSLGKSILLQPATGTSLGGCLVMVCLPTGASTYEWCVESLYNGALL